MQDAGSNHPHDNAKQEPADSEHSVVDGDFLGSTVAAAAVCKDDDDREEERDTGDTENDYLRPSLLLGRPCRQVVAGRYSFSGVEDGQDSTQHSEDDE